MTFLCGFMFQDKSVDQSVIFHTSTAPTLGPCLAYHEVGSVTCHTTDKIVIKNIMLVILLSQNLMIALVFNLFCSLFIC